MIIDNIKKLLFGIAIVGLLLVLCVAVDSADDTVTARNDSVEFPKDAIVVNGSDKVVVDSKLSVIHHTGKVYSVKQKLPTITMTGKPSCSKCAKHCKYTWRTRTYINYCPHCHRYGTLGNKHKWQSRYEQEITCFHCDSDFCINCGKTKYSWSNVYLRSA